MKPYRLLVLVALLLPSTAVAADGGWSMPNLNPFAQKSSAKATSGSAWRMNRTAAAAQPTMWQRMGQNTSQFFTRTGQMLNPWSKPQPQTRSITGSRGVTSRRPPAKQSEGWFSGWFADPEPEPPRTVTEWLGQERPQ